MAKTREKSEAVKLRNKGESIKVIARRLGVSSGTVSIWCREIKLTAKQREALEKREGLGKLEGRYKGSQTNRRKKEVKTVALKKKGGKLVESLSLKELFVAGVALYWGEGSKEDTRLQITNSDLEIVKFFIVWVEKIFGIEKERLVFYITVNEMHEGRVKEIERYWQKALNVSEEQFNKTVILKSKNKKRYDNFLDHYGTIRVTVRRSSELRRIVQGAIEKMAQVVEE
jgi:hypothetical protein